MRAGSLVGVGERTVDVEELAAWVDRCLSGRAGLGELGDDDLKAHYTVVLVVRMLVFSRVPPAGAPPDPVVARLVEQAEPCLDAVYREAARRGWRPSILRDAARRVLSPPGGSVIDPVAIFRAG